jgi:hypothetical protein
MGTMEAMVAAVAFGFGAIFVYSSYRLGYGWGTEGPQSGFFPFYVSLIICGASGVILLRALLERAQTHGEAFVERTQLKRVLSMFVPAALFVLGIQLIGIYVSSAVYIVLFMRVLGKYSWVRSIALGVGVSLAFFVMFEIWFKVSLYKGVWNLTAWTGY